MALKSQRSEKYKSQDKLVNLFNQCDTWQYSIVTSDEPLVFADVFSCVEKTKAGVPTRIHETRERQAKLYV